MTFLFRSLRCLVVLLVLLLILGLGLGLQRTALVAPPGVPNAAELARATALLRSNDPRQASATTQRSLALTESDLNLLLNQLGARLSWPIASRVELSPGKAQARASVALRYSPLALWINLDVELVQTQGLPAIQRLRVGHLPLPDWVAQALRRQLVARVLGSTEGRFAHELIKQVLIEPSHVQVRYEWQGDSYQRLLGVLVPPAEQGILKAYSDHLAALSRSIPVTGPAGNSVSLTQLLPPLFKLAQQRTAEGGDAAAENRAALLTLALHASGRGVGSLVPIAKAWERPRWMPVTLFGREDFPQHLLVSAVIAIEGGGPLADAIGVYKEVADSQGGSGFSFNDIAADRAGSRLGLLAKTAPQVLQQRLAAGVQESQLMPDVSDLPEFLSEAAFKKTYGGIDAPAYRRMLDDIDLRLDKLALLAQ